MTELIIFKIISGALLMGFFSGIVKGGMNEFRKANKYHDYRLFSLSNILDDGLQGILLVMPVLTIVGLIAIFFI